MITLGQIAAQGLQFLDLRRGLDPFGQGRESHVVGEIDHGRRDRRIIGIVADALDKRLIDLLIERQIA